MSKYLLSIFDKSGKHILTHLVAAHQGDVLESFGQKYKKIIFKKKALLISKLAKPMKFIQKCIYPETKQLAKKSATPQKSDIDIM